MQLGNGIYYSTCPLPSCILLVIYTKTKLNSVALVRERTMVIYTDLKFCFLSLWILQAFVVALFSYVQNWSI